MARPADAQPRVIDVRAVVDSDDDDNDGVADGMKAASVDLRDTVVPLLPTPAGLVFHGVTPNNGSVRLLIDGIPATRSQAIPAGTHTMGLQALRPGLSEVDLGAMKIRVHALQILAIDGEGAIVDAATSHASFQRTPPDRVDAADAVTHDPDALRYVFVGLAEDLPERARIVSRSESGKQIDALTSVQVADVPCPQGISTILRCRSTWPIRVVTDTVDKHHPLVASRSIGAELGGGLSVSSPDGLAQQLRVGGPRHAKVGPIARYQGTLRITVMRLSANGAPSIDTTDAEAIRTGRDQVAGVNARWAQCGISFGEPGNAEVRVVATPDPFLLAVGCDLGLPASGGKIRVTIDGKDISVRTAPGNRPSQVAAHLQHAIETAGFRVMRSPNTRIGPGAFPVVDLLVYRSDGTGANIATPGQAAPSSDATLPVCIGQAVQSRGLRHFLDVDSVAGTVSERATLKWIDDRDPGTIDAVFISAFESGGRIGETFIGGDTAGLRNLIIVDRGGLRASNAAHTLAHELGHVLLDIPGHPDDYGLDTPSLLMDSDAANPTAFGPLRLSVAECERAVLQSGPGAPVQMIAPWPWKALPKR